MTRARHVLGISMSNHDRSACLLADGRVVGAVAEERLDRRKSSEGFYRRAGRGIVLPPVRAITRLVRDAGITLDDIELVVCGRSITSCREELLDHLPVRAERVVEPPVPSHHLAHAYSAYASAPFEEPAVLVIDEQGHWVDDRFERCSWFTGAGQRLHPVRQFFGSRRSLSLGMFYNVFAAMAGLAEAGRPAAGKLMSLAGYGRHRPEWPALLALSDDGDARVDLAALDDFLAEVGIPRRPGVSDLRARELDELLVKYQPVGWRAQLGRDLARKAQDELQRGVLHVASRLREHTGLDTLAYAGGVALNCSTNARLRGAGWRDVHVHPAATDDGTALGLAAYGWIEVLGQPRTPTKRFDPRTGPRPAAGEADRALAAFGLAGFARRTDVDAVAHLVAAGSIVCWFAGRSEWGPRALGARSIVANPLTPGITGRINSTVKFREPFRPFGASIPAEVADELLHRDASPPGLDAYMLSVGRPRHPGLAAIAHVDGSLRYQVVDGAWQARWHRLIHAVGALTGLPAVVNTSFNTLGEPLVESSEDAVRQFLLSDADALWLEGRLLVSAELPEEARLRARQDAWRRSSLEPIDVAMGLDAAGYPAAAAAVLAEHAMDERAALGTGHDRVRRYHALGLRLAAAKGDPVAAAAHATDVLRWWTFPPDALHAAAFLAKTADRATPRVLGQLVHLAANRSAYDFFLRLVERVAK